MVSSSRWGSDSDSGDGGYLEKVIDLCMSMAVKLHKRQTISYKLQGCQVKGKDSPHWTGVPQGSKTSPTLRVKIPELDHCHMINGYLTEMSCFLKDNSLLISAPKSTVALFTPDPMQTNTHPKIKISETNSRLSG